MGITNANFLKLEDAPAWALLCTSASRPATPGNGDLILETDTNKLMLRSAGVWTHVGTAQAGFTIDATKQLNIGGSAVLTAAIAVKMAATSDYILDSRPGAEAASRFRIRASGQLEWGGGSVAADTFLYRTAADFLRTDSSFMAAGWADSSLAATVNNVQITTGTTTSGTYTPTLTSGTTCSLVFTAPSTGKVVIHNVLESLNSGTGWTKCTIEVRTGNVIGSGTAIVAANDDDSHGTTGNNSVRAGVTKLVSGLTPGTQYNVRQLFKIQSGTGTFLRKELIVEPKMI